MPTNELARWAGAPKENLANIAHFRALLAGADMLI